MSKVYCFKTVQNIPSDIETTWGFFSDAGNLKDITPSSLDFKIISKYHGDKIYAGQIIEYTIKPIANIPMYWMTEITQVAEKNILLMSNATALIAYGIISIILKQYKEVLK